MMMTPEEIREERQKVINRRKQLQIEMNIIEKELEILGIKCPHENTVKMDIFFAGVSWMECKDCGKKL